MLRGVPTGPPLVKSVLANIGTRGCEFELGLGILKGEFVESLGRVHGCVYGGLEGECVGVKGVCVCRRR